MIPKIKAFIFKNLFKYAPTKFKDYYNSRLTLIPADQLEQKYTKALTYLKSKVKLGDYLEFGVFHGTSLLCMYRAIEKLEVREMRLFGFDSFEGMPDSKDVLDKGLPWLPGLFKSSYNLTKQILDKAQVNWKKVFLVKGWYTKTLNKKIVEKYKIRKASVIMIDCDLYSSAIQALNFCSPLIKDKSIILFDDWDAGLGLAKKNLGEKMAFDEFLKANPHLKARNFGSYRHTEMKGAPISKIFLITNTKSNLPKKK